METKYGHLTYCTNIHAGENWPDHFEALKKNFPFIKENISVLAPMGIGLRLSNEASEQLIYEENLSDFKSWLEENNAYVFTMNGFPYGGFHHTRVKDNVHVPDWTTSERVAYTLRLFKILRALLPEGMDGGISTSPLTYRHWFQTEEELKKAKEISTDNLVKVVENLIVIHATTGKLLHLDVEPEPDGMLQTGEEFIQWFENDFVPAGIKKMKERFGFPDSKAEELLKRHLCLCYDICHFAIGYEPHEKVINQLLQKGVKIGKIQISAALKKEMGKDVIDRINIKNAFAQFDEPVYLHQVVAKKADGELLRYPDLPDALKDYDNPAVEEWRAHFHVPVSANDFGLLQSTQKDILEVLQLQKQKKFTQHLEVETYTWEVLPQTLKLPLQESIIRELDWVKQSLLQTSKQTYQYE
jgi:hypothetical protein